MSVPPALAPFLPGGRPVAPLSVGRRPRHVHSPRVRRLATDRGVNLDRLSGTGPLGRVTTEDVQRAASTTESRSSTPAVATRALRTGVIELEVTRLAATPDLLASVVESSVRALRAAPGRAGRVSQPAVAVHGPSGDAPRVLVNAHDLSTSGIQRALENAYAPSESAVSPSPRPALSVHDLRGTGLLFGLPVLENGELIGLSIGDVVDRPTVVALPDGGRGIGMGSFVHLALTVDEHLAGADVAWLLTQVRHRVQTHERRTS